MKIEPSIVCDNCQKDFDIKFEKQVLDPGIIESYFVCPHCGRHQTITVTDYGMRIKIEKRKNLKKRYIKAYRSHASESYLQSILEQDEKLKKELLQRSHELKEKYGLLDNDDMEMKGVDSDGV